MGAKQSVPVLLVPSGNRDYFSLSLTTKKKLTTPYAKSYGKFEMNEIVNQNLPDVSGVGAHVGGDVGGAGAGQGPPPLHDDSGGVQVLLRRPGGRINAK